MRCNLQLLFVICDLFLSVSVVDNTITDKRPSSVCAYVRCTTIIRSWIGTLVNVGSCQQKTVIGLYLSISGVYLRRESSKIGSIKLCGVTRQIEGIGCCTVNYECRIRWITGVNSDIDNGPIRTIDKVGVDKTCTWFSNWGTRNFLNTWLCVAALFINFNCVTRTTFSTNAESGASKLATTTSSCTWSEIWPLG